MRARHFSPLGWIIVTKTNIKADITIKVIADRDEYKALDYWRDVHLHPIHCTTHSRNLL